MKKFNERSVWLQRAAALMLAAAVTITALPMDRVQALKEKEEAADSSGLEEKETDKEASYKETSDKEASDKETFREEISEEQFIEEQSTEKQSIEEQSTGKQSIEEQSTGKQSIEEQSTEKQSIEEQSTEKQSIEEQSINTESSTEEADSLESISYEAGSEEFSESYSEAASEEFSESYSETASEEFSESYSETANEPSSEEMTEESGQWDIEIYADSAGAYDYRTHYGTTQYIYINISNTASGKSTADITNKYTYSLDASCAGKGTVKLGALEEEREGKYKIPIEIIGTGTETISASIEISGGRNKDGNIYHGKNYYGKIYHEFYTKAIEVEVKNSPLREEDFEICVREKDGTQERTFESFKEWKEYLSAHKSWVNKLVEIRLTPEGKKYYNVIKAENIGTSRSPEKGICISESFDIVQSSLQAENDGTGARTCVQNEFNFDIGADLAAPVIKTFKLPDYYYAQTSTEDIQYFPRKFAIKGGADDALSGLRKIEYTAEMNKGKDAKWHTLEGVSKGGSFELLLGNGVYEAIAVRAFDNAGNVSALSCFKNENGEFVKAVVDDTMPDLEVSVTSENAEYSAEGENWTNKAISFHITDKQAALSGNAYAGLYKLEYAYQGIADALSGKAVKDDDWHELEMTEFTIGGDSKNPMNKNGCYYFRGTTYSGVKSRKDIKKRVLLWQKPVSKKPLIQTGAEVEKCHNGWYNIESGAPVIDFEYPEYDTGAISREYAVPVTLHYSLSVEDEKNKKTSIAADKTAAIWASEPKSMPADKNSGFTLVKDDISKLQITFPKDGIYTLEYWISDAAGNESERDIFTYKIDREKPENLRLELAGEKQPLMCSSTLSYDKFYKEGVTGRAEADYGVSRKESIKILKARRIGDWKSLAPSENAEQFRIEADTRCLLYIKATDGAGNTAEGWTSGIIADSSAPMGDSGAELIIEPEGANKHGFFNKDIKLGIRINDTASALKLVSESLSVDGVEKFRNKELFSGGKNNISENELAQSERFSLLETIDAKLYEGNSVKVTVSAIDRSGNESTCTKELKIDVTKPEIKITFDNDKALNGRYYSKERRARIDINELNFDASLVEIKVKKDGKDFSPEISEWQSDKNNDKNNHFAYVEFSGDGDYTLCIKCRDLADNEADEAAAEPFTIDKSAPRVEIKLESGTPRTKYFNKPQTAIITVTERNFNPEGLSISINDKILGKMGEWEHENDTHVIKAGLSQEGAYSISCEYKDLAGNEMTKEDRARMPLELVIDRTAPKVLISGVEDNSANAGEVVPVITVLDENIELSGTAITLAAGKGESVDISSDISAAAADGGFVYTLNGLSSKKDDVYYLTVKAADKAQNTSELTYRFSLNRRGSSYDIVDIAEITKKYYNSYSAFGDIEIIEMNVDKVEDSEVYISHNSDIIYGRKGERPKEANKSGLPEAAFYDVSVLESGDNGYVYKYTIYRENFADEGTYRVGVYSKDNAGNEVNNLLNVNGEEVSFIIDNTMPRVMIEGAEERKAYSVKSKKLHVSADDNVKLAKAEFMLINSGGDVLERWNYLDLAEKEGDTAVITIDGFKEEVSLIYSASDAAGNEIRTFQEEKQEKAELIANGDKVIQISSTPEKLSKERSAPIRLSALYGTLIIAAYAVVRKNILKIKKRK